MLTTVKQEIAFVGTGLHSGRPVRMIVRPAATGGLRFRRTDVTDRDNVIPARYDLVNDTRLNTRLTNAAGVSVSTVEHLMAALAGDGRAAVPPDRRDRPRQRHPRALRPRQRHPAQ
ncbi:hypothetical protein CNY89_20580, partial [Amaricoccus sp. HAR-UPW-R2A-40]